jgi:hypothetical protein
VFQQHTVSFLVCIAAGYVGVAAGRKREALREPLEASNARDLAHLIAHLYTPRRFRLSVGHLSSNSLLLSFN